jgi:hypothetical protein
MMRTLLLGASRAILVGTISVALSGEAVSQGRSSLVTKAQYERWQVDLSNWGRWGKDDEMGTLNLITPGQAQSGRGTRERGIPGVFGVEREH